MDSNRWFPFFVRFLAVYLSSSRHFCSLFLAAFLSLGMFYLVTSLLSLHSQLFVPLCQLVSFIGSVVCIVFLHTFCHASYAAPVLVKSENGDCRENCVALGLCTG